MHENQELQELLQKFVLNQCSPEEIDTVVNYFRENNRTEDFPTVEDVKILLSDMPKMSEAKADEIFSNILIDANAPKVVSIAAKKSYRKYIAIAASIIVLLSIGLSYQQGLFDSDKQLILNGNEITLQLENGDIQVITNDGKSVVMDANGHVVGNQQGNKIVYDAETGLEKLAYNTIKIPNGKRFELQLSDGTNVHLNAGTTLKYPVKFIAGLNRQVFLNGEAFFDVAKDKKHPFVVNAEELNVRVLGTHFNVSNYPEDDVTDVVLVEGLVGLYTANSTFDATKNTMLTPGYKGSFNKATSQINTKRVNTNLYTSWMKGGQNFRDMAFSNIAKKLERNYNVRIDIKNIKLANEKFNASFGDEPIEKVLSYFSDIHAFDYTMKGNEIIIK